MDSAILWQLAQVLLVPILAWLVYEIRQTRISIEELNVTVAVATTKIEYIEGRLTKIELEMF